MRFATAATMLTLCAGVTLFAGAASAQRLDDGFLARGRSGDDELKGPAGEPG